MTPSILVFALPPLFAQQPFAFALLGDSFTLDVTKSITGNQE